MSRNIGLQVCMSISWNRRNTALKTSRIAVQIAGFIF